MAQVKIITPRGMFGAYKGEHALATAMRIIGVGFGDADDWCAKYGANFENDVFLMKRYCWCEKGGECPWCTGCAIYQDRGECEACNARGTHEQTCATLELARRLRDAGLSHARYGQDGRYVDLVWKDHKTKDDDARENSITSALLQERKLKGRWETCDCSAKAAGHALKEQGKECPYSLGTGIFARFAPWTDNKARNYYDPPNFWFKPADFRVTWYKYIGRDMASNKDDLPGDFMERVFATHPKGMTVEDAVAETARQEGESAASFAEMFASLGASTSGYD